MTEAEADELLAQAIRQHADAYNLSEDGELLADYAIIANWQPAVDDTTSRYTLAYHRHHIPNHIARGLFTTALHHLDTTEEPEDDGLS